MERFDPQHPFAFNPPDYDSLPKEPPKYEEIYNEGDGGVTNTSFTPDTTGVPPPGGDSRGPGVHTIEWSRQGQGSTSSSPRSHTSIQFTTHGNAPLEELPPYEMAILEPSTSLTVNYSPSTNQGSDSQASATVQAQTRITLDNAGNNTVNQSTG